jgi:trk system potassium uptake protein
MSEYNNKIRVSYFYLFAGVCALVSLIVQYGFYADPQTLRIFRYVDISIALFFVSSYLYRIIRSEHKWREIKSTPFESILLLVFILSLLIESLLQNSLLNRESAIIYIKIYFIIIQIYVISNLFAGLAKTREKWLFISLKPSRVFIFSFFMVIVIGVGLLKLPRATYDGISLTNAVFISTSAVCVTGLTPLNVSETFTPIGQSIILLLFQIGGLGIVTLTSFVALFFQQKGSFRLRDQAILMEILDDNNLSKLSEMIHAIVRITLSFEIIGALILWLRWRNFGFSGKEGLFKAVFHSVSAYCNAGFSNLPKGLETVNYSRDPLTMITVMILIILGGLGFYTLRELLYNRRYSPDNKKHYSLQTRMILFISLGLVLSGTLIIALLQWNEWSDMPNWLKVMNALFTSITSRTAGFSTISVGALSLPAIIFIMLLMYIGAAPNSTGGGIKVTTFGMLIAASWAFIRGKNRVEIGWSTIPITTIRRSYIVLMGSLSLIIIAFFLISMTESAPSEDLLFEIISAFGTVGLSRGVTPFLSDFSKIVITIVMFMGRVGLYTLAIAVGRESVAQHKYEFPETNVMVG